MNDFKETFKKWWWVGLIVLFFIGKAVPNNNNKEISKKSSNNSEAYYKWPCKYCGKILRRKEVLSPNQGIYTAENGFAFCSQGCWHAFRNLGH